MKQLSLILAVALIPALALAKSPINIPAHPKDVLDCPVPATMQAWTLALAVDYTQSCLNRTYAHTDTRLAYQVDAHEGKVVINPCPPGDQCVFGPIVQDGIVITIHGTISIGDGVLNDLHYSLDKRGGQITGFYARVDNQASRQN